LGHNLYGELFGSTEKRLFEAISKYALRAPKEEPFRLPEFKKGGYEFPELPPYHPDVYRDAADDWPCTKKWTFDFFKEKFGDKEMVLTNNVGLVAIMSLKAFAGFNISFPHTNLPRKAS
jgi:hypothetical protein